MVNSGHNRHNILSSRRVNNNQKTKKNLKMKFAVVFAAVLAIALAHPLDDPAHAQVLRYDNDNIGVEGYKWAFETSDGKTANEEGQLENVGTDDEGISVRGSYSYVDPSDGQTYTVNYIANKDGFQPEGAHIPRA